ncbi:unnamed protein product [Phytophthora fragariaefolia]|uniref:Unnamed protein product n=1 Tax=Phytophthora fragariaefolia TaxID=1490495 RepID=A0A9W7D6F7_9STRA|nr:unnamed protein product [Phytophthora fragariaefolia]
MLVQPSTLQGGVRFLRTRLRAALGLAAGDVVGGCTVSATWSGASSSSLSPLLPLLASHSAASDSVGTRSAVGFLPALALSIGAMLAPSSSKDEVASASGLWAMAINRWKVDGGGLDGGVGLSRNEMPDLVLMAIGGGSCTQSIEL